MNNLQKILSLSNNCYDDFIQETLSSLSSCKYFCPKRYSNKIIKTCDILNEDTKIVTGYAPLIIDDNEIYKILFDNLKKMNNGMRNEFQLITQGVQKTVFDYCGSGRPDDFLRTSIYRDAYYKDKVVSIKNFKSNNLSMCTERSCIAHNLFKILGLKSCLVAGEISLNGEKDLHTFNVVEVNGESYIYDLICTPIRVDKPMPQAIMHKLSYEQSNILFNYDNKVLNFEPISCDFSSQSGNNFHITYENRTQNSSIEQ